MAKPSKKTWSEKLNTAKEIKLKRLGFDFAGMPKGSKMLVATPKIIDEYIKEIPEGCSTDIKTLREDIALNFRADHTCPVSTGIFLKIVAEAAYEKYLEGLPLDAITPFWRVIAADSKIATKLSFEPSIIAELRSKEGL